MKKIVYESAEHKRLLTAIQRRWRLSREKMSERYTSWAVSEEQMMAFIPTTELDSKRKSDRSSGLPQYTTIEVPFSYAQLLAAHTYWTSVFLARTPVMQFEGRHGEPEMAIKAVEAIVQYQMQVGAWLVPLYIWLMDAGKYGLGVIGTYWEKEEAYVSRYVETPRKYLGIVIPGETEKKRETLRATTYEGNKLYNVRPYDFFPDPRVPVSQFQSGEFCGRYVEVGWNYLKKKEAQGRYFNIDNVKGTKPSNWLRDRGSSQLTLPNSSGLDFAATGGQYDTDDINRLDFIELMEMHIELIPSEWQLGESTYPEKWVFTVANDKVIIGAEPLGLLHNKFPFDILEYEVEGYGLFKRGMPEMIKPLNDVITWLFNSHFYNVRKVLNDQLVVDPSRVVMQDVLNPKPGRIIRLKPGAYGTDPKLAVQQLQVVDVTQQNIRDVGFVAEIVMRMTGVNDQIMGMVNTGGRKSATEIRASSSFGVNRLKTNSEYFSAQGWALMAQKILQNTQQFYDAEQQFRIAGNLLKDADRFTQVTPDQIAGFFDFVPVDGTMPVDRYAQAALWRDIMTGMRQFPQLMMEYDIPAIFAHVAHLAGIRNVNNFRIQVTPDQQLMARLQAGNVVPAGGQGGRARSAGQPRASAGSENRPATVAQVGGVGPSG